MSGCEVCEYRGVGGGLGELRSGWREWLTSSPSTLSLPSELSKTISQNALITLAPAPSWSMAERSSWRRTANFGARSANWIASKKLDLPEPLRPTMAGFIGDSKTVMRGVGVEIWSGEREAERCERGEGSARGRGRREEEQEVRRLTIVPRGEWLGLALVSERAEAADNDTLDMHAARGGVG